MASFKSHPVFISLLLVLGLIAAGEGFFVYQGYSAYKEARTSLDTTQAALEDMSKAAPAPSEDNRHLVAGDYKQASAALDAMRAQLKGKSDELIATMPDDSTKVQFAIDTMIETMAKKLKAVVLDPEHPDIRMKVKDGEHFGFNAYFKTGPSRPLIPEVYRQLKVVETLLNYLADAKPEELVSVKRERARGKAGRIERQTAVEEALKSGESVPDDDISDDDDLFLIDPYATSRSNGFADALSFKISFTGVTSTLQAFLNSIAQSEYPLITKQVDAEVVIPEDDINATDDAKAADKPKVRKPLTKFTVTVEFLELIMEKSGSESTPSADSKPTP